MVRVSELRRREVVNVSDGRRMGFIIDLDIDFEDGKIRSLVLPGGGKLMGIFGGGKEIVVSWSRLVRVGIDTILVDMEEFFY